MQWKPILGTKYVVSEFGAVMNTRTGKTLKPTKNPGGYFFVVLCTDSVSRTWNVHRVVATGFLPNPENKAQVNHKDGCKENNHVSNLEWMTAHENQQHAVRTGLRKPNPEKPTNAKLNADQVRVIKSQLSQGLLEKEIAAQFGVHKATINDIKRGVAWRGVA